MEEKTFRSVGGGTSLGGPQAWGMQSDTMYEAEDGTRFVILSDPQLHFQLPQTLTLTLEDADARFAPQKA